MTPQQTYGVKETGEVLDFVGAFVTTTGDVAEDKKVSLVELTKYISLWPVIGPAFDNFDEVALELGDLDSVEREQLKQRFGKALKLKNPATDDLIEEGADLALHMMQFIVKARRLRTQTAL